MKHILAIVFLLFVNNLVFSQQLAECEKIVFQTYEAINQKNADLIMKHLSSDFTIAGHSGEVALLILPQLFEQLNMKVANIRKVSVAKTEVLTLVYEAEFGKMGVKQSTFIFNEQDQLKSLELFPMQVMTKKGNAEVSKDSQSYFTIPFKRVGNLIAVQARLNGEERTFLVDNGAPVLVVNNAHFRKDSSEDKLTLSNAKGAGGSISAMSMEKIESFQFGGITMDTQNVVSMDLSHLEKETNTTFYGLLGYEIYKEYDLLFDYNKNTITFIKPEATNDFLEANYQAKRQVEVQVEMGGHLAIVKGEINGKKYTFGIDCGAESSLFDIKLKDELKSNFRKLKKSAIHGADKQVVEVYQGKLNSLVIGGVDFRKTETSFSDISHLNDGYKLKIDGIIGYDFLSNQPTLISYVKRKLVLLK